MKFVVIGNIYGSATEDIADEPEIANAINKLGHYALMINRVKELIIYLENYGENNIRLR